MKFETLFKAISFIKNQYADDYLIETSTQYNNDEEILLIPKTRQSNYFFNFSAFDKIFEIQLKYFIIEKINKNEYEIKVIPHETEEWSNLAVPLNYIHNK
jgi:hypothetical protein